MAEDELSVAKRAHVMEACLLGCAVGDAIALPYEGLKPSRLLRCLKLPLEHRFFLGRMCWSIWTSHAGG